MASTGVEAITLLGISKYMHCVHTFLFETTEFTDFPVGMTREYPVQKGIVREASVVNWNK